MARRPIRPQEVTIKVVFRDGNEVTVNKVSKWTLDQISSYYLKKYRDIISLSVRLDRG
jgi:hypothetical protein